MTRATNQIARASNAEELVRARSGRPQASTMSLRPRGRGGRHVRLGARVSTCRKVARDLSKRPDRLVPGSDGRVADTAEQPADVPSLVGPCRLGEELQGRAVRKRTRAEPSQPRDNRMVPGLGRAPCRRVYGCARVGAVHENAAFVEVPLARGDGRVVHS